MRAAKQLRIGEVKGSERQGKKFKEREIREEKKKKAVIFIFDTV